MSLVPSVELSSATHDSFESMTSMLGAGMSSEDHVMSEDDVYYS